MVSLAAESLSDDLETALRTLFQVIDGSAGTLGSMVHMAFVDPPLSIAGCKCAGDAAVVTGIFMGVRLLFLLCCSL